MTASLAVLARTAQTRRPGRPLYLAVELIYLVSKQACFKRALPLAPWMLDDGHRRQATYFPTGLNVRERSDLSRASRRTVGCRP